MPDGPMTLLKHLDTRYSPYGDIIVQTEVLITYGGLPICMSLGYIAVGTGMKADLGVHVMHGSPKS
ncbi:hypothetical protein RhiirC2_775443 [Rhizophagus irregularis]|uniref:Uncharacterized protein n=1 Tax=Rhizophagus irregularis TaxID=588596 RepID=A0A2N1NJ75_9GLOM|nr:hypothetical protein RhiirC2_775443 [Rhizophagus irregularis]